MDKETNLFVSTGYSSRPESYMSFLNAARSFLSILFSSKFAWIGIVAHIVFVYLWIAVSFYLAMQFWASYCVMGYAVGYLMSEDSKQKLVEREMNNIFKKMDPEYYHNAGRKDRSQRGRNLL